MNKAVDAKFENLPKKLCYTGENYHLLTKAHAPPEFSERPKIVAPVVQRKDETVRI